MNTIRNKLITVLVGAILCTTMVVVYYSIQSMENILNKELERSYSSQLKTILLSLEKKHSHLKRSGLEGLYKEGYKASQIKSIKEQYYNKSSKIFPIIIDRQGKLLLSPFKTTSLPIDIIGKGTTSFVVNEQEWWLVHKSFTPWGWTIGHTILTKDKNSGFYEFTKALIIVFCIVSLFFIFIFAAIISRLLFPIEELSKKVTDIPDGEFDLDIRIYNPNDEVGALAIAFKQMLEKMSQYITEKIDQEKKLNLRLEEKVKERTIQLESLNNELSMAVTNKRSLLRVLAHDLANPLSIINLSTRKIKKMVHEDAVIDIVNKVIKAETTLSTITKSIIKMESIKSGKIHLILEEVSLEEIINQAKFIFEEQLKEKNIILECDIGILEKSFIIAEKNSFSNQVMNNLLSNAIKFSNCGSVIKIIAKIENSEVCISIIDEGVGMPEELLKKVFEDNAETSRQGTTGEIGTGFGMPLVKSYIDHYGARIIINSKEQRKNSKDHGTTVELYFKLD
ncbi:hypothetical protein A9Q84_16095 [Halobacteriovorax marinus]|uniref:histidine kinase n=1 Tax=Halobacteriovorax marinus TaxID=97084 RepID=A0A1Y5F474_9BACT|nr:hypothetical protein A9Q84_16095 [Halobacteriovorax marinus]